MFPILSQAIQAALKGGVSHRNSDERKKSARSASGYRPTNSPSGLAIRQAHGRPFDKLRAGQWGFCCPRFGIAILMPEWQVAARPPLIALRQWGFCGPKSWPTNGRLRRASGGGKKFRASPRKNFSAGSPPSPAPWVRLSSDIPPPTPGRPDRPAFLLDDCPLRGRLSHECLGSTNADTP